MVAQAWTIFAGLVKEAELIGCELRPNPTTRRLSLTVAVDQDTSMSDCEEENEHDPEPHRRVWWLLVELDTRLSFLLGRRPNISPSHGVCKPTVAASRHEERELQQSVAEFSQYMLEVLSHAHEKAETHSGPAEGRHTLHADLAQLNHLPSKLPGLPQNAVTDPDLWLSIAARQIDRQLFVMVLHCQILRKGGSSRNLGKASFKNYYKEILDCARAVTDLFDSFFNLDPSQSASCWPRCLGVYCAAAILGIALLRQEIDLDTDSSRVERMMQIFQKLTTIAPDAGTARLAVRSLGEIVNGIKELQRGQNPNSEPYVPPPISNPATMPPDDRQSSTTSSVAAGKAAPDRRIRVKRQNSSTFEGDVRGDKKRRFDTEPMVYNDSAPAGPRSAWQAGQEHPYPPEGVSVFNDIAAASFSEPSAHGSFSRQSFPTSASTSFAGRDQIEYSTVGYAPAHTSANDEYHAARWWVHPPMAYHPPMYDDGWQHQDPGFDMLATSNGQHGFYAAPSAPAMNHPLPMQDDIRGGQQVGLTNLSTASPSRGETLIIGDPQLAPPGGSTQVPSHASGRPQDPPFYNPPAETYQNMDHSLSSPGIAEGATHPEGVLGRLVPPSRRQSATDIRQQQQQQQQQLAPWSMEVQATVPNTQKGDGPDRTQSPQRVGILSPVSEADSSMPRVVAAQGNASMVQKHPSQILVQNPESESYPGSRRHSTAHVEEVSLPERAPLGGRLAEAVEENANQQAWARQAQMQGMYSAPTAGPYRVDMPDYTIPYDQRFHGHLHPPQVITTGAFHGDSGGHRWWSG